MFISMMTASLLQAPLVGAPVKVVITLLADTYRVNQALVRSMITIIPHTRTRRVPLRHILLNLTNLIVKIALTLVMHPLHMEIPRLPLLLLLTNLIDKRVVTMSMLVMVLRR